MFAETELILTNEKRVYHINLKGEDIADDVIVVGDQHRVAQISAHFSKIEFKTEHREFVTHTGIYNGKRITVLSTGIGTDNLDIVMNELDAAVNINLETRALQADIPVNAIVVSSHGIGLDGLLPFYHGWESVCENDISDAFIKHTGWAPTLPFPYCVKASEALISKFKKGTHIGITATAPGFYGPQGRQIRLKAAMPTLNEYLTDFKIDDHRITNFEMETSALYGLGKLLNHQCLTACVIIANRVRKEFTSDYKKSVEILIQESLQRLTT
jgi:uridine phosphorylase